MQKNPYTKGQRVLLCKGAVVHSCNPSKRQYTLTRDQTVKLDSAYDEYGYGERVHPAEVVWAGTGGYWCWTDAENVLNSD